MGERQKINERFVYNDKIGASDIYRKFKVQFDALFNPNEIAKTDEEFEKIYVHDLDFENALNDFRESMGCLAAFCVGYTGIGKTTSIRHCFNLGIKNIPVYNPERKELVFPSFFDGHNLEKNYMEDLSKKISAMCTFIEKENPKIKSYIRSKTGLSDLVSFIQETKPEIVEVNELDLINLSEMEEIKLRIQSARENYKYSYYAIRLKFLISKCYDKYERLIIILDDVESLPHDYQQNLIRDYLSMFECMVNTKFPKDSEYNINILISLRPHTYRLFNNNRNLETYPILQNPITKNRAVNLSDLFKKRFDYYTEIHPKMIGNIDSWNECYESLNAMNNMFDGQYKTMIINLCYMNIREALSYYSKIFANRLWLQKNKQFYAEFKVAIPEYIFNNITIIRALACNENTVYFNETNNLLPCIFLTNDEEDYTIYCLLMLNLFYKRRKKNEAYGQQAKEKGELMGELNEIFPNEIVKKFEEAIFHLFEIRILRKSIKDKDDYVTLDTRKSLNEKSFLYISSKGEEMWRMFSQDSVLLELFREEVYRDYDENEFNNQSSYELMQAGKQKMIFIDLLKYIEYLMYREDDLRNCINSIEKKKMYMRMFGGRMVVAQLLDGVDCSLRYSGKYEDSEIQTIFNRLHSQILKGNL